MTLLVGKEHFHEHKSDYGTPFRKHSNMSELGQVVFCTISKAKQIGETLLMQFRDGDGYFQYRDAVIVDEGGKISSVSFSELLDLCDEFKRLVVCGDPKQGGPFSKKRRNYESVITMLEERASSNERGIIKKTFLHLQYRMEPDIGDLMSRTFYEGRLLSHENGVGNLFCHFVKATTEQMDNALSCKEALLALR